MGTNSSLLKWKVIFELLSKYERWVLCSVQLGLSCSLSACFLPRLNLNVSYVICHKIINLELEPAMFLAIPYFFSLLIFPRLSTTYILISYYCKKMNGSLHFVNLEFHTLSCTTHFTHFRIVK